MPDRVVSIGAVAHTWSDAGRLLNDGTYTYTWNTDGQLITVTDGVTTLAFLYDGDAAPFYGWGLLVHLQKGITINTASSGTTFWENFRRSLLLLLAAVYAFAASACQHSETLPVDNSPEPSRLDSQDEQRVLDSFLTVSDVPTGWVLYYSGTELLEGDTVYQRQFVTGEVVDQSALAYIFVLQELVLYGNESQAREDYQKQLQFVLAFPQAPAGINFQGLADEFKMGCSFSTISSQPENVCTVIARYDRLVSMLTVKVWDHDDKEQWFTWTDFERVLEAMDRRALDAAGR